MLICTRLLSISLFLLFFVACGETLAPNVLLITVDTLRADYLDVYGDERTRSSRIAELASGGTVFENAAAPMPLTLPSHSSMLTSRYPREHGVLNNRIQLPEEELTLAEIFSSQGYQTGAFVSVVLLNKESGADQGFDAYHYPTDPRERSAEETVKGALDWLANRDSEEPFFLWVHLFDPHLPYSPKTVRAQEIDEELYARYPSLHWKQFYEIARNNDGDIPTAVVDYAQSLYRSEIENVDFWVGALLDGLEEQGQRSNTITVLTSDHGEPFENGVYFEHSDSLYDGAIRIPLIVNYPALFPEGKRVDNQVSIIDIAPTLLAATGIEIPNSYSGMALQDAEQTSDRYVLIQFPFYQPKLSAGRPNRRAVIKTVAGEPVEVIDAGIERVGIVGVDWKLIRTGPDQLDLYTRAQSHGEDVNVTDTEQSALKRLRSELSRQLEHKPVKLIEPEMVNDELLENLKALGYAE